MVDLIVRHGGLTALESQIRIEGNTDIKKAALKVVVRFLSLESRSVHEMVCEEMKRLRSVSYCAL